MKIPGTSRLQVVKRCLDGAPPAADKAPAGFAVKRRPAFTSLILAIYGSFLSAMFFSCACCHIDPRALPFTFSAVVCAIYAATTIRRDNLSHAIVTGVVLVITMVIFLKNVADVMWFGHHAVWPLELPWLGRAEVPR